MMTGPLLIAAAAMCSGVVQPTFGFVRQAGIISVMPRRSSNRRLFQSSSSSASSSSSSSKVLVNQCVSRMTTLQKLLSRCGAPGSVGCGKPHDLQPVVIINDNDDASNGSNGTPELVSSLQSADNQELVHLHPYLFPIAKSKSTGNYICAYRNPSVEIGIEASSDNQKTTTPAAAAPVHPWPIVETTLNGPGMKLLALNSEHLMRRIACEHDNSDDGKESDIVAIYNYGLGQGKLSPAALDAPYQVGSVTQLGYGVDKYVLLRVGPFADLYQSLSQQHAAKGDEQSCLIAAEAANTKLAGFASNYKFYAQMLTICSTLSSQSYPRDEEARDAARMCLRLPLSTIGMTFEDFQQVAILGQIASKSDSISTCLIKLRTMYEKIRQAEKDAEDTPASGEQGKTPEQIAIDEANYIIDNAILSSSSSSASSGNGNKVPWASIRGQVAEKFRSITRNDFAAFVELKTIII